MKVWLQYRCMPVNDYFAEIILAKEKFLPDPKQILFVLFC
jgi:hypothetical protein